MSATEVDGRRRRWAPYQTNPVTMTIFHTPLTRFVHAEPLSSPDSFHHALSSIGIEEQGNYLRSSANSVSELAFKHHPDTSSGGKSSDTFVRIKDAFQSIMEGPSGIAVLRNHHFNKDQQSSDENELDVKWKHSEGELNNHQDEHNGLLHLPSIRRCCMRSLTLQRT